MTEYRARRRRNIRMLKDGRAEVRIEEGEHVHKRILPTYKAAERYRDSFKTRAAFASIGIDLPGEDVNGKPLRIHALLDAYITGLEREGVGPNTLRDVRQRVHVLKQFFSPLADARRIDEESLRNYWHWRKGHPMSEGGTGGVSILREIAYLRAALGRKKIRFDKVPADLRSKAKHRDRFIPDEEEVPVFLQTLQECSLERAFCEMLAFTGRRKIECRTVRWQDLDLKKARARYQDTKPGTTEWRPLFPEAVEALQRWLQCPGRETDKEGHVFVYGGRMLKDSTLRKRILRGAKAAGLPFFEQGTLRHFFAFNAVSRGLELTFISWLMGHKRIQTTMIYVNRALRRLGMKTLQDRPIFRKNTMPDSYHHENAVH